MTLKCWFAGIPLFVDRDLLVGHYYRTVPYPAPLEDRHWNRYALFRILLDDPTFWLYWRPLLASFMWKPEYAQRLKEVEAEAAAFKVVKVRTDAEFFREFLRMDMPFKLDAAGNVTRMDADAVQRLACGEWLKKQRTARHTWSRELLGWAFRNGAKRPDTVLDIGCRDAQLAPDVAKLGAGYTGLEIVPELVEAGKKAGLRILEGEATDLSRFRDGEFDVIVASHVLEHCTDPAEAVCGMCRVASDAVLLEVPRESPPNYGGASHVWSFPSMEALTLCAPPNWTAEVMRGDIVQRVILRRRK